MVSDIPAGDGKLVNLFLRCRHQDGTECGIESSFAHETSILEAGIDFSSSTYVLSLFLSVSLRNFHTGGIDAS